MKRATLLLAALLLAGCGGAAHRSSGERPAGYDARMSGAVSAEVLNGDVGEGSGTIVVTPASPIAFHGSAGFDRAVAAFAHETQAQQVVVNGMPGAAGFRVSNAQADASLERWNREYLRRGAYVFRYLATGGYTNAGDGILLVPTRDPWTVLRAAGVNGADYGIDTGAIVQWLRSLQKLHPFSIYGAGVDFVEGRFASTPTGQDALILARSMDSFDPDIVDQGTGSVAALARVLEQTGTLYMWWD